ncbi:MAG: monovalent cation/H(+) antiporter subunit G [Gammaproteobacteria bacterium]
MRLVADLFLLAGALFGFLGALGLVRMPDAYNRIQAGTKAATLGALCILIGVGLLQPDWWAKLLVIAGLVLFTNPVGSSTIARSLYRAGLPPWQRAGRAAGSEQRVVESSADEGKA